MKIGPEEKERIIALVRQEFPGWESVNDDRFVKDEIGYKRNAVALLNELLNKDEVKRLISAGDYEEFVGRLDKIGHKTNLLWYTVPLAGDLRVLYQPGLDKKGFCEAMAELLYGNEPSPNRLSTFCEYLKSKGLPNNWPFPTYFLFLSNPETDMFVRPTVAKWVLDLSEELDSLTKKPTGSAYTTILSVCAELRRQLAEYGVRDMVDVQSLIWVASSVSNKGPESTVSSDRREQLLALFDEFVKSYLNTDDGRRHETRYSEGRQTAVANYQTVQDSERTGKDITDPVLLKLLPYADTESNRQKGAFVHVAPSVSGDVKAWFEGAGWAKAEDWPKISRAIYHFVKQAIDDPSKINLACKQFSELGYTKGFQTGMLSPILNALDPDQYLIINNKSRRVINYFMEGDYRQGLVDYPAANRRARDLISELGTKIEGLDRPETRDGDLFDMFCHWLVGIKQYDFRKPKYWKIAPGENAWNWDACREGGFIAIGWDEFGDLSGMSKSEFDSRYEEITKSGTEWTKAAVNQVWKFTRLEEGDKIVANRGTEEVLGLGTISGEYYFVPNARHGHRIPVDWYDLGKRQVKKDGWRRTLVQLDEEEFREIVRMPVDGGGTVSSPFSANAFDLLKALHDSPTQELYRQRNEEFKTYVEEPLQRIMGEVAQKLPPRILDLLETKKGIFGRIPKNDYGKAGAWDFYWGAFYPKGGKRITDAQLFVSINKDQFRYGFYIGEYGSSQRDRFIKNCGEHAHELAKMLSDSMPKNLVYYGDSEDQAEKKGSFVDDFGKWIRDHEKTGLFAAVILERSVVEKRSKDQLVSDITRIYENLFPLIILSTSDDPMPKISEYLHSGEPPQPNEEYPPERLADDISFEQGEVLRWVRAIERKKQIIFYGPPGTGKTYIAKHLARHLIGGGDGFEDCLQFHPSYAYEDFIQGIRPKSRADGGLEYPLVEGRFMEFCRRAKNVKGRCVLILDEINRANLSRVFGELMYLLEYRDESIPLASGGEFHIPQNAYLIGTMNTADRSIALVDHALRRRFAFIPLKPNFEVLRAYHEDTEFDPEGLIKALTRINANIGDPHYEVGITFFLRKDLRNQIADIWQMEIEPYLEEYFYDQRNRVDEFRWAQIQREILTEGDE